MNGHKIMICALKNFIFLQNVKFIRNLLIFIFFKIKKYVNKIMFLKDVKNIM